MKNDLSIVIPVYNEVNNLDYSYVLIRNIFNKQNINPTLIYVDDGSTNKQTKQMLKNLAKRNNTKVITIMHSGQQTAISVGLTIADIQYIGVMDCDMQV